MVPTELTLLYALPDSEHPEPPPAQPTAIASLALSLIWLFRLSFALPIGIRNEIDECYG